MRKILNTLLAPFLAGYIALAGCDSDDNKNKSSYVPEKPIPANFNFLDDGVVKIGAVSDIEGAIDSAKKSAGKLKGKNLDAIIIAGDCYENEEIRRNPVYPNSTDNVQEMIDGITPYAELGIPVFVIPGNHEEQSIYNEAISTLRKKYPNIFDINGKSIDAQGVNLVGMGGYHDSRFITREGFLLNSSNYQTALKNLKGLQNQNETTIFITHSPPKANSRIDYVQGAGHVGDSNIATIMNSDLKDILNVHGHIHEGGRNSEDYSAGKAINVASITPFNNLQGYNTELITIKDGKVSCESIK